MTDIRPFCALRYTRNPAPRIAPPYDVISEAERTALAAEPENIVHLTLPPGPEGERDYKAAAHTLEKWIGQGILRRDGQENLYVLEEHIPGGRVRRGFLGLLRLADYEECTVLPHERTMEGPKRDRLLLTRAVHANLEPLFFLYEDRDAKLAPLLQEATCGSVLAACPGRDGSRLALYAGPEAESIASTRAFLADRSVIIADGHHRYETMLRYRDECREAARSAGRPLGPGDPHEFVLAYLVNAFDPGSEVRAIHRVLEGEIGDVPQVLVSSGFQVEECTEGTPGALLESLNRRREREHAFVFARAEGPWLLASRPRGSELDVEVLHAELLPGIRGALSFDARPGRLLERVGRREVALGILMNAIDPDSLFRVVQSGRVLPQKSTFFSPKIPSGLVIRDLGDVG